MSKITNEEVFELMKNRGLTVKQCIDVVIQENAIIGVGLISLNDNISEYIKNHKGYQKIIPKTDGNTKN